MSSKITREFCGAKTGPILWILKALTHLERNHVLLAWKMATLWTSGAGFVEEYAWSMFLKPSTKPLHLKIFLLHSRCLVGNKHERHVRDTNICGIHLLWLENLESTWQFGAGKQD